MDPQARTSTMLNPTGSLDFSRLTYSFARVSPASKWVSPFCSGNPCFATFSLWKLKNTNLPKNRDRPVLRLITKGALSSALTAPLLRATLLLAEEMLAAAVDFVRGLRPWKHTLEGFSWWRRWMAWQLAGENEGVEIMDEAAIGTVVGDLREKWPGDEIEKMVQ